MGDYLGLGSWEMNELPQITNINKQLVYLHDMIAQNKHSHPKKEERKYGKEKLNQGKTKIHQKKTINPRGV